MTVEAERVAHVHATKDDALIASARQGDRDAFSLLIEPRAMFLLRTARAILGNETDASESVQDALVAAWVQLPRLRDADRFDAWLNRTLVNKCRDALRRRGRVREIDLSGIDPAGRDTTEAFVAQTAVLAAFDHLSLEERDILVLRHLHDLAVARIADLLHIPVGTAKSRLWRARRALERALEAES